MTLRVRPNGRQRLQRLGKHTPLIPKIQMTWIEDLSKAVASESISTEGARAAGLVADLAHQRIELQDSMNQAVTELMGVLQQLKVEGVEGVAGQVREQAVTLNQVIANQRMLVTGQNRLANDLKNLEQSVRELMRLKAPARERDLPG